ncbi:hypothetical protein PC129_g21495 [Phytophthora cactorum]|uniref:Uncharacterized protein n=1 Tax=Phytophthora cactorum TaxID=29920 RepID=A0A8T0XYE3_9STRA|nr:hypothetical protein Pcac1_g17110 [Phytophthora cactorum]KAG2796354.1 hypothetical protein PC111_g21765 [Phytophthora cactorum]KAG2824449.1 hypothetical protein PC113_g22035 [Phytophthora cactorum]KAG2875608.1 hypothetical protein PC114_g24621 [Phytophthora cactorum]KAG2882592.1 hypothetical protein PC115_g21904 [Phytophthora cactorum]
MVVTACSTLDGDSGGGCARYGSAEVSPPALSEVELSDLEQAWLGSSTATVFLVVTPDQQHVLGTTPERQPQVLVVTPQL